MYYYEECSCIVKLTCISLGKVALKSIVCLTPRGGMSICSTILRICGSKPISSILSASSRAKYLTICSETLALSRRSTKRPGVATRISTPLSSSRSCRKNNIKLSVTKLHMQNIKKLYILTSKKCIPSTMTQITTKRHEGSLKTLTKNQFYGIKKQ